MRPRDAAAGGGLGERHRRRPVRARDPPVQRVDDGAERRDRDGQPAVAAAAQRVRAVAVEAAEAAALHVGRDRGGLRGLRVVERDDVLALLAPVQARERVHAGLRVGVAVLLGAVAQRAVLRREPGEPRDRPVERMRRLEVGLRVRAIGPDQVVVEVVGHLAGEHRLARELVAARAGEALLVAVVDDRVAAREVHELVREPVAGEQLGVGRARVAGGDEVADPAHVVVAEERRQLVGVRVGVRVPVVVLEERAERVGRLAVWPRSPARPPGTGSRARTASGRRS